MSIYTIKNNNNVLLYNKLTINTNLMRKLFILILILPLLISAGKKSRFKVPKDFAFIPLGSMEINGKVFSSNAFIMQKYEVTNLQYREFLNDLKAHNETEKLKIAEIDSLQWRISNQFYEPYVEYYHSHPAYNNYPIVNISYEAALLYCDWLSEKYKKENNVNIKFRLPSENEWIYAAKSGNSNNKYAWEGNYLRNKKGKFQCNFNVLYQENPKTKEIEITENNIIENNVSNVNNQDRENNSITVPVNSYYPNKYKLYNMSGNVAEMTSEKGVIKGGSWNSCGYYMQIDAESEYTKTDAPSPFIGFRVVYTFLPERDK